MAIDPWSSARFLSITCFYSRLLEESFINGFNSKRNSKLENCEMYLMQKMRSARAYTVDLTTTVGTGEVMCPKCGNLLSPDDDTDKTYIILEAVTKKDLLQELVLRCNKCRSEIRLMGFNFLAQVCPKEAG